MKAMLGKKIKVLGLCFALVLSTCSPAWAEVEIPTTGPSPGTASADTDSIAIGDSSNAYNQSIAIGNSSLAGESTGLNHLSTAIGYNSEATDFYSTALGHDSLANNTSSTAVGGSSSATGTRSSAYGASSLASGASAVAIGDSATASAANSVALGAGSTANLANTVSVGAAGSERQITNMAAGTADTDAVNVGQLNTGLANLSSGTDVLSYRVDDLDSRINKVGAMSAAISGLMALPYDPDTPTQFQIGAGSYGGEQAVAAGLTYYANGSMAYSLGFSTCGGETMGRIGATWSLGHSSDKNKKQTMSSLTSEVKELQAQNQKLQEQIDKINQMMEKNAAVTK